MSLRTPTRKAFAAAALACCVAVSGCSVGKRDGWRFADWDVRRSIGLKKDKPDPEVPTRLVSTWTDAVLNSAGQPAKRGFGGRLIFFTNEGEDPVRVDGQLVVYAFDETDRPSHETHPTRRYVFPPEQFAKHESESQLGPSYSVWLPWDEVGGHQKKISLIARFEPSDGAIVMGEQTRHLLPGLSLEGTPQIQIANTVVNQSTIGVQLAGFQGERPGLATNPPGGAAATSASPAAASEPRPQMSTATIPLPQRLGARLQEPAAKRALAGVTPPAAAAPGAPTANPDPTATPSAGSALQTPQAPAAPAAPAMPARGQYLRSLEVSPFGR